MTTTWDRPRQPTPCLICETDNAPDAILCEDCCAPLALVHEANAQERDPRLVSILGDSNAGKTVFLGFLLWGIVRRI